MSLRKVAVVTPGSFVIPSGRSSSVERVVEQTVPLVQEAMEIRIYGVLGKGLPPKGTINGVPCYRLPSGASYYRSLLRRLYQWKPEVAEIHNRPFLAQRLKMQLPGVKVVLTLHSNTFISPPYMNRQSFGKIASMMDGIVVNSRFLLEDIVSYHPWLEDKITINHLGVNLEQFPPPFSPVAKALREAKLAHYGWKGRRIILFAGRLIPDKGVHHLIEALPQIINKHPEVLLLIIGSASYGSDRETSYIRKLKNAAKSYQSWVTFLPFVPYPGIADWYALADIVVVPSSPREAFGLVNVEAMAAGAPVIASSAGGIPEIVENGVNGFLIPSDYLTTGLTERINGLLEDEFLRTKIGMAGRESVRQRFRWDHTAERWVRLMQNI
ncbi:Glycosyltransferase involved in cell wall bisynthesis [Paenibacillus uliginis N3/975]|uniref:Glycosyltransferase involved in cell wall bisynthesis n=1 Tax=Paenibacillus uliginis N3/975 TaxID=1313296 RepID=A0A1X7HMY9_9BACL|nr:glycosyltransferase family 4 protein [Paenibacillus uliginis]SMF89522.1 Glycosyltransferase involved in cell wall bisynthesis [Paenibacillus uliginis N3/975]